ncbi:hypothetical protein KP509_29G048600 [Ceratopteris richardii]|uniref:Galactosyl transferase GMA12/MNN10 family protein n=1 Tax=Ceratopteris richardii TaxID=49495 RepID=A0A8T2R8G1_CERRI|nr:hypothetical protein KP509_29G048600 [Ceratopteris richardii]
MKMMQPSSNRNESISMVLFDGPRCRASCSSICRSLTLPRFCARRALCWLLFISLSCGFVALRSNFLYNVSLDMGTLCEVNQKVRPNDQVSLSNSTRFTIVTFADAYALSSMAGRYTSLLESRSMYASLHGYGLRVYFHRSDMRRSLVWSKVTAIHEIFFQAPETPPSADRDNDWIWLLDLDALIFNFNVKLESIVESARAHHRGNDIDVVIAMDHNGVNAGSFFVRKSEWTRQLLRRWWQTQGDIVMVRKYFEQGALHHLIQTDKSIAAHVHIASLRQFNAYGYPSGYPSRDLYRFREGDFIVHCPSPTLKRRLPGYAQQWEKMMQQCKLREAWMHAGTQLESPHQS